MFTFPRRRSLTRIFWIVTLIVLVRLLFPPSKKPESPEIRRQGVLDLVTREKSLDARKYKFLQARMGRDDRQDLFSEFINNGLQDYWNRFQKP